MKELEFIIVGGQILLVCECACEGGRVLLSLFAGQFYFLWRAELIRYVKEGVLFAAFLLC